MIVIISGSPRKEKSRCRKYAETIASAAGDEYKLYDAGTWYVDYCKGCEACLSEGHCIYSGDDYDTIIEDIRQADALIFASPVYCGTITGQMKTLIDRMMADIYAMPLIGKPAIALAVSEGNHHRETADYIKMILEFCGASVISSLAIDNHIKGTEKDKLLNNAAVLLKEALAPDFKLSVSDRTRNFFARLKVINKCSLVLSELFSTPVGIAKKWKESGYMDCADIDEVIIKKEQTETW